MRPSPLLMLIAANCLTIDGAAAQSLPEECRIGKASPAEALKSLQDVSATFVREHNDWLVYAQEERHYYWDITTERHPAHPTAVKRCLREHDGQVMMGMDVMCGATREVCDQVVAQFRELNAQLSEALRQQQKK
jgi:hypothetical protein